MLWKKITIASSLFECKRAPANPSNQIPSRIQTLELNNSLKYTDFRISRKIPAPTVGRPVDPSTGRPGGRPGAQQRVRSLQSVDRAVDRSISLCTLCTPVDRIPDAAGGRPGRSTAQPVLLLLCYFATVSSVVFCRRLPRRSLDDLCRLP